MMSLMGANGESAAAGDVIDPLRGFVEQCLGEFDEIPEERRKELEEVADWVGGQRKAGKPARLTFVCTHNSRRSHLSQLWAQVGVHHYGVDGVETFSGGIEATACNIRTVRALRRAGMAVVDSSGGKNPVYLVQFAEEVPPMQVFSKKYDAAGNPKEGFAAVMTCDHADQNCPVVIGAEGRFPVHFRDPKESDDSPEEETTYDERCAQVAREMFYLMSRVEK